MDCRAFRVSSVFITVSPLLPPRLRRGGAVVHQAASARLSVRSVASVCGCGAHIQPGTQRLSFIWCSACSAASPFFIFSRVPCGTGQSGLIQGCDNLWLFQVSEEVCFAQAATSRACENQWRSPAYPAGCVTCDHTRGSERRGCCTRCRN